MNVQLLCDLARIRSNALLAQAATIRAERARPRSSSGLRNRVARALIAMGDACANLGDALAETNR
jgi:hypothetical protein